MKTRQSVGKSLSIAVRFLIVIYEKDSVFTVSPSKVFQTKL